MEHSVDLSAKTFVQAVSPSSARTILKKMEIALQVASNDSSGTFDLDDLEARLDGLDFDDDDDGDDEGDDDEKNEGDDGEEEGGAEEDAGDSIGKALLLVKQVFP
jgi:hypothetical protein